MSMTLLIRFSLFCGTKSCIRSSRNTAAWRSENSAGMSQQGNAVSTTGSCCARMVSVCFYFQVHQPYRLRKYTVFDIGQNSDYFFHEKNKEIIEKIANKCYLPANAVLHELLRKHPSFKVSFSFSGVVLEQFKKYAPGVLESFRALVNTGRVEILSETYYHSLSFLYSKEEFRQQIAMHRLMVQELFGYTPTAFRNTELIYNNELAKIVEGMGYKAILAEGADHILGLRSPHYLYMPTACNSIALLLKSYKLSDDIAFRFSNKGWADYPLDAQKYAQWINAINGNGYVVNLFMDYETFGEHQWQDTGIFSFLGALPGELLKHPHNSFVTPSEAAAKFPISGELDVHHLMSWADVERDLSAWLGNSMQHSALSKIYEMEPAIKKTGDEALLSDWRKLQT